MVPLRFALVPAMISVLSTAATGQQTLPFAPQTQPPVFSAQSELVVLQVAVEDRSHAYITNLPAEAFTIREDNVPQMIEFFNQLDAPVTVGLIIDASGSMAEVRDRVAAAAGAFVATSNPDDEVFAITFNEHTRAVLPEHEPFTNDPTTLRAALRDALAARGRTALHDAVLRGFQYVARGMHDRRALIVVGDGGDNASAATFDRVLRQAQMSNTLIYTIAVVDPLDTEARPARLKQLAEVTGGEAFQPRRLEDIPEILAQIARDIRNMYTIGYVPPPAGAGGAARRIRVTVKSSSATGLTVRTRRGYVVDTREP